MGEEALGFGVTADSNRTKDQRFEDFHRAHPEVWEQFQKMAVAIHARGFKHYSADIILHLIRWKYDSEHGPNSKDVPKVNDWFTAYYAELFRQSDKKYAKFFIKKEPKAK